LKFESRLTATELTLPRPEEPECPRMRAEKRVSIQKMGRSVPSKDRPLSAFGTNRDWGNAFRPGGDPARQSI
jgi:hypothetical protein